MDIDSFNVEYGVSDIGQCTFLGDPNDLHADFVKSALSLNYGPPLNTWDWPPLYKHYHDHNYYGKLEDVSHGRLTLFGLPPFYLLLMTFVLQGIVLSSPSSMLVMLYLVGWIALGGLCWWLVVNIWERLFAFVVLALSYPFVLMLTRANMGAALVGFLLVVYIYMTCNRRHFIVAAFCLALACNIRPNAVLLAPLFLCFGWRQSIGATILFLAMTVGIAALACFFLVRIYPGYSLQVFSEALGTYKRLYILGPLGDGDNNSAYGMVKLMRNILFPYWSLDFLDKLNNTIFFVSSALIVFVSYKFWRGRLPRWHFAFLLVCLYILASTVFATYHLLVLYAFILAAGGRMVGDIPHTPWILFLSASIIIPKNYFNFLPGVSCGVVVNPLILFGCVIWILCLNFPPLAASSKGGQEGGKATSTRKRTPAQTISK